MSNFFQSEIVKESIKELNILQQQIIEDTFKTPFMSGVQKKEHIELMKILLEKQKNLYFRLSLSDDPEAIEMTKKFKETAKFLGFNENNNITQFFNEMEKKLDRLYNIKQLDN